MSAQTSTASGDPPVLSNGGQPSSPPAQANQAPSTPTLNSKLWKEAYDRLDQELKQRYEAIIKADLNTGLDANLEQQAEALVRARKQRVENRQWMVKWRGRSITIRDQIDTILNVIQKTADIISFPMQFAPPYVSLPWTAVTILLPFLTNDSAEHQKALEGLKKVTIIVARFQIVEQVHLDPQSKTFGKLRESIVDLYSKIFEYQARLANYLGKNTLRRFGINALQLGGWSEFQVGIDDADKICQDFMAIHDSEMAKQAFQTLGTLLGEVVKKLDEAQRLAEERRLDTVLSWISDHDAFDDHVNVQSELGDEYFTAGQWLVGGDDIRKWQQTSQPVFVLRGGVGTGKSSLVSILIEHLLFTSSSHLAFYYCSRGRDSKSEESRRLDIMFSILRCLLRQLCYTESPLGVRSIMMDKYERRSQANWTRLRLSEQDLSDIFVDVIEACQGATIVVDALDECYVYQDLLTFLAEVAKRSTHRLCLFLSAREGVHIESTFSKQGVEVMEMRVEDHSHQDIMAYLDFEIFRSRRRSGKVPTDDQAKELRNLLQERASGMFRWIKLQLDLFLSLDPHKKILDETDFNGKLGRLRETSLALRTDALKLLREAYNDIYDFNVGSTPDDVESRQEVREEIVKATFLWVLASMRPLRLGELLEAVTTRDDGSRMKGIDEDFLLTTGSNFIRTYPGKRVDFAHASVRDYLLHPTETKSRFCLTVQELNARAAARCLRQLLNSSSVGLTLEFSRKFNYNDRNFDSYSSTYWSSYLRNAPAGLDLFTALRDNFVAFLNELAKSSNSTELRGFLGQISACVSLRPQPRQREIQIFGYQLAALCFHDGIFPAEPGSPIALAQCLLALGLQLDRKDNEDLSLLDVAIERSEDLLEALLYYGATVDLAHPRFQTSIHQAARRGSSAALHMLLEASPTNEALSRSDYLGMIPLDVALESQNFVCADMLWRTAMEDDTVFIPDQTANKYAQSLCRGRESMKYSDSEPTFLGGWRIHFRHFLCGSCRKFFTTNDFFWGTVKTLRRIRWAASHGCSLCQFFKDRSRVLSITLSKNERAQLGRSTVVASRNARAPVNTLWRWAYAVFGPLICLLLLIWVLMFEQNRGLSYHNNQRLGLLNHDRLPILMGLKSRDWGLMVLIFLLSVYFLVLAAKAKAEAVYFLNGRDQPTNRRWRSYADIWFMALHPPTNLVDHLPRDKEFELCHSHVCSKATNPEQAVNVLSAPNNPFAQGFRSFSTFSDLFGDEALQTIKGWHDDCAKHEKCRRILKHRPPGRVLDVSNPDRVFLRTEPEEAPYVFFSYVSGPGGRSRFFQTTKANFASMREGIQFSELSRGWQDAIDMTRRLGYRYLFIDALCIIQDDYEDWELNTLMGQSIGDASLVIASASFDPTQGFRHPRPAEQNLASFPYSWKPSEQPQQQKNSRNQSSFWSMLWDSSVFAVPSIEEPCARLHQFLQSHNPFRSTPSQTDNRDEWHSEVSIRDLLDDSGTILTRTPWAGRGWTLAERYLPSRILIFAEGQIFWNCRTHLLSDASRVPQVPLWQLDACDLDNVGPAGKLSTDRVPWYRLVEYYTSASELTSPTDALPAVAGLAAASAGGDRYFAGIWYNDIDVGLLWRSRGRPERLKRYAAPTWSWGSMNGPVTFSVSGNKRHHFGEDVEFREIEVRTELGSNRYTFSSREALKESEADKQYGWALAGHVRLTALSRSVRSDSKPAGTQYYFDFNDDKEKWEVGGAEVIVALFSRWETFSSGKIQWHGLLLERVVDGKDQGVGTTNETRCKRVGVYMGDLRKLRRDTGSERVTEDVGLGSEWERQKFMIV